MINNSRLLELINFAVIHASIWLTAKKGYLVQFISFLFSWPFFKTLSGIFWNCSSQNTENVLYPAGYVMRNSMWGQANNIFKKMLLTPYTLNPIPCFTLTLLFLPTIPLSHSISTKSTMKWTQHQIPTRTIKCNRPSTEAQTETTQWGNLLWTIVSIKN